MDALHHGELKVYFTEISPEGAKKLLSSYKVDYRKFRPTYADSLARDMASGHWNFDGSPIRIDRNGDLFDGQHRLNSVVLSETTQTFLFIEGLPVEAYNTTDTGLARNYGDTLRRRGYNNVSQRTALVKLIARWDDGRSLGDTRRFSNSELDEVHDKYVDSVNRIVSLSVGTAKRVDMPPAVFAFCWWVLHQIDVEDAYTFMTQLAEGENLNRGMPVFHLRARLRQDRDVKLTRNDYAHLVFQGWNAFRNKEEKTRYYLPSNLTTRESMEIPK